jgi:class 3 adenylate cyclase
MGHMTEVLLLSFALADRINTLKIENENKQKEIILQLEENQKLQTKVNRELEQKVSERTAEVVAQKDRSEKLLLNILPAKIADELMQTGFSIPKLFNHVTVIFTDFENFTGISETLSPEELVEEINKNFTKMDQIIEKYGLEKIKTIGDAYLAVCGLPNETEDHAERVVNAALEIRSYMLQQDNKFGIRIGVHSGQVVAGIVGVKKFAYDIWGDTVNTASRLESKGEVGKVNISEATYELVKDKYKCMYRGKVEAKGKGEINMYFVEPLQ